MLGAQLGAREYLTRAMAEIDKIDATEMERLAAELAVKLAARMSRGGLVVVTGASGSGKSSLLRAGLLPILARGQQVPGSDRWPRIVMMPTKDPLTELAAHLDGRLSLQQARESTVRQVRQYARRQLTWFRADPRVHWLSADPEMIIDRLRVGMMAAEAS